MADSEVRKSLASIIDRSAPEVSTLLKFTDALAMADAVLAAGWRPPAEGPTAETEHPFLPLVKFKHKTEGGELHKNVEGDRFDGLTSAHRWVSSIALFASDYPEAAKANIFSCYPETIPGAGLLATTPPTQPADAGHPRRVLAEDDETFPEEDPK